MFYSFSKVKALKIRLFFWIVLSCEICFYFLTHLLIDLQNQLQIQSLSSLPPPPPHWLCQFKKSVTKNLDVSLKTQNVWIKVSIEIIREESILINLLDFCAYIQCGHWRFIVSESTFSIIIRIEQKQLINRFFFLLGVMRSQQQELYLGIVQRSYLKKN